MAAESQNEFSILDQLMSRSEGRRTTGPFFPIIVGLLGPPAGDGPDRIVLVNPATQSMLIVHGDAAVLSEFFSESGGGGLPPASKASIEALRTVEKEEGEEEEEECSVCLDGLKERDEEKEVVVKEMPCKHRFHGGCIEKWLRMHGSCPVCRFKMPVEEKEGSKKSGDETEGEETEEGRRGMRSEIWVTIAVGRRENGDDEEDS